jgi:hypothetical protein
MIADESRSKALDAFEHGVLTYNKQSLALASGKRFGEAHVVRRDS